MLQHKNARARVLALVGLMILLMSLTSVASAASTVLNGTVNADKVFFRTRPNTSSDYHGRLDKKTKLVLLDSSGAFYKVRYDGKEGYVMKKFVDVSGATARKLDAATQPKSTSKYADTTSISKLGGPPKQLKMGASGTDVEKLQRALQLKKVYSGVVDGKFGNQTREALLAFQKKNGLSQTGAADYDTIKKLFGTVAETSVAEDPAMKGITRVGQIGVPNTTSKGDRGKHVKALQQALKLKGYYKAEIDSSYGDKTVSAVMAFQKRVGLSADGVAGNGTIKKLFGQNAANYTIPTQELDWFDGGTRVIPKGAIFTVKDVATGKTFSMKRWSGANHLDAEPLNAKATQTIKDVYGGNWSWERRAILVRYNDKVYAASMNGMPHGTTTVKGNEFNGHVCIHFTDSKTHETNKVDQLHQSAVKRAKNADW